MLRRILIPLDSSKFTPVAVRVAARVANAVRNETGRDVVKLRGLGIVDLDQIPSGRFASLVNREEIIAEARQGVEKLTREFIEIAASQGVPEENLESQYVEGSPFKIIMQEHVFTDLVVIGEECSFLPNQRDYATLENVFHRSSRPIIITRDNDPEVNSVVMALDGGAPASRMLYSYLHVNPFPGAKVVLTISQLEEENHDLGDYFERAAQFLMEYGFEVEKVRVPGALMSELPGVFSSHKAGAFALGVHQEHFMERLRKPMQIGGSEVETLLDSTSALLYTVH